MPLLSLGKDTARLNPKLSTYPMSRKKRGGHDARARPPPSWAPRGSTDLLLPPIYTYIPRKHPGSQQKTISTAVTFCIREIPSLSLRRRSSGGGIDHGGLLHQHHSPSDELWVVYHRPSGPWLLARWLLLSFWISIQRSPPLLWRTIRCNLHFAVCLLRPMNCGFMIKFIYEQYLNLLNSFMYDWLSLQVSSNYQFGLSY